MKNKLKKVSKKGRISFVINSQKGQNLNMREVEDIQNGIITNCLPLEVNIKGKSFTITYDVTNYLSLEQYLHTMVNKKKFTEMMLQMLQVFSTMTDCFYSLQNLVLDMDKVMVNPSTNQILFVFVPILHYDWGVLPKEFLIQCIYNTTFDSTENMSYVEDCLAILQRNINFSVVELQEYLRKADETPDKNNSVQKQVFVKDKEVFDPFKVIMEKEYEVSEGKSSALAETESTGTLSSVDTIKDTMLLGKDMNYVIMKR